MRTVQMTLEEWHSVMDTNVTGMVIACQAFYEPLKASPQLPDRPWDIAVVLAVHTVLHK